MGLRSKVSIILAGIWLGLFMIIYAYSKDALIKDYLKIENKAVIADIERTKNTLDTLISRVKLLTYDWAQWNDTYAFMQNKNEAYIKSNLAFTTFENAKINLIMFFDNSGKLFYGVNYDLVNKKFVPIPQYLLNYLANDKDLVIHKDINSSKMGLLEIGDGYVVLCSLPILTSEGKGPIRGTIMFGYFFTTQLLKELSTILDTQVQLYLLPIAANDTNMQTVYQHLQKSTYFTSFPNQDQINGYTFIHDIHHKPIGIIKIQLPRTIYKEGLATIERYLGIIITIGVIFLVSIWFLLKIFVLDRVISVSKQVIEINSGSKFANRIKLSGQDEIAHMVVALNSLMEIIELTQEQLKYRLVLRTDELERLSKLNQNLYTEMSKQKRLEAKRQQGEQVLKHLAYYDYLTDLPNRVFFNELLVNAIASAKKNGSGLAILFLDIDRFKEINDTYGHQIGDQFLQHVAIQLKNVIKEIDLIARISGDEFIVCLRGIREKSLITKVAEKLLIHISQPLILNDLVISSTSSIGISIFPEDGTTLGELEKHADIAMYYAKKKGNTYCYYDQVAKEESAN
jgi:diguanylate cyclase (GGDEF)-like protein